jgi:hypothetical protein
MVFLVDGDGLLVRSRIRLRVWLREVVVLVRRRRRVFVTLCSANAEPDDIISLIE